MIGTYRRQKDGAQCQFEIVALLSGTKQNKHPSGGFSYLLELVAAFTRAG